KPLQERDGARSLVCLSGRPNDSNQPKASAWPATIELLHADAGDGLPRRHRRACKTDRSWVARDWSVARRLHVSVFDHLHFESKLGPPEGFALRGLCGSVILIAVCLLC